MSALLRVVSFAVVLLAPLDARAQWWCAPPVMVGPVYARLVPASYGPVSRVAAYAPVPVCVPAPACVPAPPCGIAVSVPGSALRLAPRVDESRPPRTATVGQGGTKPAGDRCAISFWNHSDRDVSLRIDGRARQLPRGRGLTLDLPRRFVWQLSNEAPQTVQVPAGETAREIAIR